MEISNLKDQPYEVFLHVNGMPDTSSAIVLDAVTITPRGTDKVKLVLLTSSTAPEASRRRLSVHDWENSSRDAANSPPRAGACC
ncbi:hypothetical protein [Lentzea sp. NPDC003310]|uniref:hypothetical protein n=1 Tax=Lentzea sp. NPDC003310 TaxID=3154447 RepID=UPI0033B56E9B